MKYSTKMLLASISAIAYLSACSTKQLNKNEIGEFNMDNRDQIRKLKAEVKNILENSHQASGSNFSQITEMTAIELAMSIRDKKLTSEVVTAAFLSRALDLNPSYNAIVTYNFEALTQARAADIAVAKGEVLGSLQGVPFTIKDTFSTKGLRSTAGSEDLKDYVPESNAIVVQRLLDAGGILMGKTNTPARAMDVQTTNKIFGTTENALRKGFTAGGSSGGPAVAVAKRFTPFDIGSDIAGSIRIPAAFNGIYGFRPTFGYLSLKGHIPPGPNEINGIRRMAVPGPLAHSIEDIQFLLPLLAGPGKGDYRAVPMLPLSQPEPQVGKLRIAWTDHFGNVTADESTRKAISGLIDRLSTAGANVAKAEPQDFPYEKAWETWGAILGHQSGYDKSNFVRWIGDLFTRGAVADSPTQRKIVGPISVPTYMENLRVQDDCINQLESFLEPYDVWIVPVAATTAFPHTTPDRYFGEFPVYDRPIMVDNRPLPYWVATLSFTTIFSLTESPVMTIPIGKDKQGLPIGVQIIGKRFSDLQLLRIAKLIDQSAKLRDHKLAP